tara:strand:+ start:3376 stop:4002 length:627 start_codon:yes stop_codon:yes gene_type:complete
MVKNKGGCKIGRLGERPKGGCKIGKKTVITKTNNKKANTTTTTKTTKTTVKNKPKAKPKARGKNLDNIPLAQRAREMKNKKMGRKDDDDDVPLSQLKRPSNPSGGPRAPITDSLVSKTRKIRSDKGQKRVLRTIKEIKAGVKAPPFTGKTRKERSDKGVKRKTKADFQAIYGLDKDNKRIVKPKVTRKLNKKYVKDRAKLNEGTRSKL